MKPSVSAIITSNLLLFSYLKSGESVIKPKQKGEVKQIRRRYSVCILNITVAPKIEM